MIKINLLPPGIYEKKIVRNIAIVFAVLAVAVAGGGFGYRLKLGKDIAEMTAKATEAEQMKAIVDGIFKQANDELAKIQPMTDKVTFIEAVYQYNTKWPDLYQELAKYTYEKVVYRSLTPTEDGLEIEATIPRISDVGRFLMNMYRATHIFTSVTISGLPGYPITGGGVSQSSALGSAPAYVAEGGELPTGVSPYLYRYRGVGAVATGVARSEAIRGPGGLSFTVSCKLKELIAPPTPPGAAAAQGQPGMMPGMPGMPGMSAPAPSMAPAPNMEPPMPGPGGPAARG